MPVYMISYDLNAPGKNYTALIDAIKAGYPDWWHCLGSTWLINTTSTSIQIRDYLAQYIDRNDKILVAVLGRADGAWWGFDQECSDWLQRKLS